MTEAGIEPKRCKIKQFSNKLCLFYYGFAKYLSLSNGKVGCFELKILKYDDFLKYILPIFKKIE